MKQEKLFEKHGGWKTNYVIKVYDKEVDIVQQGIIRRAVTNSIFEKDYNGCGGYGYGYESLHFEFKVRGMIDLANDYYKREGYRQRDDNKIVMFVDEQNIKLGSIRIEWEVEGIHHKNDNEFISYYSINLIDIPIWLMKDAKYVVFCSSTYEYNDNQDLV